VIHRFKIATATVLNMKIYTKRISLITNKNFELIDVTDTVKRIVSESNIRNGFSIIFSLHTTTGLIIQESEEGLMKDIVNFFEKIVPREFENYRHTHYFYKDGRMAVNPWAHLRSILTGLSLTVPVENGDLLLGGRQRIFFVELDGPQRRTFVVQVIGE